MPFPIKICAVCSEEFELKPGKPGFANRCPECSAPEADDAKQDLDLSPSERKALNEERRQAMRNLLYRKDS
jgi:predicted amidophosphoribosyltransferase